MPESMYFSFSQLQAHLLIPMCISLLGGIVLLLTGVCVKKKSQELYVSIALLFVIVNLGFLALWNEPKSAQFGFFNLLFIDGMSLLTQIFILIATLVLLLFFLRPNSREETQGAEFYALILFAIAGFAFMVSSKNLLLILLGLECASLSIYTLIALHNKTQTFEAAIKYFVMGALATALYAFGALLLYAATGSIDISSIAHFLQTHKEPPFLVFFGFVFLLCALGFKISIVPFHTWGPDVYEASNALLTAFIAITPKIAALCVIIRIFDMFLAMHHPLIESTLYGLIILTMTVPNCIALVQKDVKRMLAYSSISHSGFVLGAIFINAPSIVFTYWFYFMFVNIGVFGILWLSRDCENGEHTLESLRGLKKTNPTLAILLTLFMFALAGIPPFCMFWAKMYLLQVVLNANHIILALIMAINSIIAAFYYLKVIIYVFAKPNQTSLPHIHIESSSIIALAISFIMSILSIFMAQDVLNIIAKYI